MVRKSPTPRSIDVSASELTSYEAACKQEPILKSFDSILQNGTKRVITSLANDTGIRSLSFSSLKEVAGSLLEMNKQVVSVIIENQEDVWKNQSMLPLVELFFDSSSNAMDFCSCLENCLRRIKTSQLMTLQFAVQQFHKEVKLNKAEDGDKKFRRTLEELNKFKECEDPFPQTFFDLFDKVYNQQLLLLTKLRTEKRRLDEKLKNLKTWRKVSNLVFVATFASVLILSVVAAAVTAPPVVTALAAALSVPMGSVGKWCDALWKRYEREVKGQREIVSSMKSTAYVMTKDLQNIRVLGERFEIGIMAMKKKAELTIREEEEEEEEEMVRLATAEIEKELNVFEKAIEDIHGEVDKVNNFITMSRTVILRRIIDYAHSSPPPHHASSS